LPHHLSKNFPPVSQAGRKDKGVSIPNKCFSKDNLPTSIIHPTLPLPKPLSVLAFSTPEKIAFLPHIFFAFTLIQNYIADFWNVLPLISTLKILLYMNSKNLLLIVIIGAILLLGGCGCNGYNGLVKQDENVKAKWANVQSDYQRRADLIPNLVNTVKGAANFEQETLVKVQEARSKATSVNINADDLTPEKIAQFQQAQTQLSGALGRLIAVSENYPDLKANQNYRDLQAQLEGTENRIKVSRNDFNGAVQEYNGVARSFPNNIFAGMFGFKPKTGFTADPGSEKAPTVDFGK
jgi:LemA protein